MDLKNMSEIILGLSLVGATSSYLLTKLYQKQNSLYLEIDSSQTTTPFSTLSQDTFSQFRTESTIEKLKELSENSLEAKLISGTFSDKEREDFIFAVAYLDLKSVKTNKITENGVYYSVGAFDYVAFKNSKDEEFSVICLNQNPDSSSRYIGLLGFKKIIENHHF